MSSESDAIDSARRDLCSRIFADPEVFNDTITHEIRSPFRIEPHAHPDILQFDLMVGCTGNVTVGEQTVAINGITAMTAAPGVVHGYLLQKSAGPCRVYNLKLKCPSHIPALDGRAFAPVLTGIPRADALVASMRLVVQLGCVRQMRSRLFLPRLTEVLSLWPSPQQPTEPVSGAVHIEDDLPTGLAAAVALIDRRLDNPPGIKELADVASMSERHFSRVFLARFGCTAHTYSTARRYSAARELLLPGNVKIAQVAERLGFSSIAIFSRWFRQLAGVTPRDYRASATTL